MTLGESMNGIMTKKRFLIRSVLALATVVCPALSASIQAQEWAKKMFSSHKHEFGVVARGAKAVHRFELQNIYEEDIHIASVRTSCGCTTPTIEKRDLKTWEKGAIVATYNTRTFIGKRGATITVVIDKPYYAEVQLRVDGYIRSDVVIEPPLVEFGKVTQGSPAEAKVSVRYAGRSSWKIQDVLSSNDNFEVQLAEKTRGGGRVIYDMIVRLKDGTPPGFIRDELTIVTDDSQRTQIPLSVEGNVVPLVTVDPSPLVLGVLAQEQSVTKNIIVRAPKPFKIVAVNCDDDCFQFKTSDVEKAIHVIPVTFTGTDRVGTLEKQIEISTSYGGGTNVTCTATATVNAASSDS